MSKEKNKTQSQQAPLQSFEPSTSRILATSFPMRQNARLVLKKKDYLDNDNDGDFILMRRLCVV
jgi:hypothetical protein